MEQKEIKDVRQDLIELFEIGKHKDIGTRQSENKFYIDKQDLEREEVLSKLQSYFSNGITIKGGYISVSSITFVFTFFEIKEGKPSSK